MDKLWDAERISHLVSKQLDSFWDYKTNINLVFYVQKALVKTERALSQISNKYFYENGFSPYNSSHYSMFLYNLSNILGVEAEHSDISDCLYYLNKSLNAVDWYWAINLPEHFAVEHPVGSVLGRARYGDYLYIYQGTTVGGNRKNNILSYPILGHHVLLYAHSTVLGKSTLGNNVIISANTYIKDENIPDCCIVFGSSPNLIIKQKSIEEIKEMTQSIWIR